MNSTNRPGAYRSCATLLAIATLFGTAHADLLFDPSGGTDLKALFSNNDDATISRPLAGVFNLYNAPIGQIYVCTNGSLVTWAGASPDNRAFPYVSGGTRIAPLWDDFVLRAAAHVWETSTAQRYTVTWSNIEPFYIQSGNYASNRYTFQATLFLQGVTQSGINFHAGDIAFGYGQVGTELDYYGNNFVGGEVGINNGDGLRSATLPDGYGSNIVNSTLSRLPLSQGKYVLFHWDNSSQNYKTSIVPEPSTLVVALASLAFLWRRPR